MEATANELRRLSQRKEDKEGKVVNEKGIEKSGE